MNTHTKKKQISGKSDTCYVQISHETKKNEHDFKSNSNVFSSKTLLLFISNFSKYIHFVCYQQFIYFFRAIRWTVSIILTMMSSVEEKWHKRTFILRIKVSSKTLTKLIVALISFFSYCSYINGNNIIEYRKSLSSALIYNAL